MPESSKKDQFDPHSADQLRLLEATAAANIDGVSISDASKPDLPLVYVNPGFEKMTGYSAEDVIGENCRFLQGEHRDESAAADIRNAIRNEQPCRVTLRNFRKDGVLFWNELTLYPLRNEKEELTHYVGIQRDVTERKKLEAQFLQAQRMDSIGRLVGGIAHDLGNLLVPVLIGSKRLQKQFADNEKAMRTIELIRQSGERGSEMVRQVLAFARGVEGERITLDPKQVVKESKKFIQDTFPPNISLEVSMPADVWKIEGDETQLQQILVNLCVNARDAMPEGGKLTVIVENILVDSSMERMILDSREGEFVRLTVSDSGTGIPTEIVDKVFEPFFTTKSMGTGTGLGLSTVYNIIKGHGGFVTIYSEVDAGTSVHVYLPRSSSEEVAETDTPGSDGHDGANKLVLVVDDEPFILEAASEALADTGYRVLIAENGREALELYNKRSDEISAVLIDLMMPEMDGLTTIRELRGRNAGLPIVATSGLGDSKARAALEAGTPVFLSKPFSAAQLYEALERAFKNG